jgi:hypothetical protein
MPYIGWYLAAIVLPPIILMLVDAYIAYKKGGLELKGIHGFRRGIIALTVIQLFEEFRQGPRIAVISDLTRRELEGAPEGVKKVLLSIPDTNVENVSLREEAESLAQNYIHDGVVSPRHIADAQHIAIASVEQVDVLVSWNFQQIVNLDRIRAFNSVNLKLGYPILEIGAQGRLSMKKKFDAVKFQREAREQLTKQYTSDREGFLRELKEKYGHLRKQRIGTHTR